MRTEDLFVHAAIAWDHVADQLLQPGHVLTHGACRCANALRLEQHRLNLAQLHAEPPKLDLVVGAAEELEIAVGIEAAKVTGAVDPRVCLALRREGVRHEALARLLRKPHVAARDSDA